MVLKIQINGKLTQKKRPHVRHVLLEADGQALEHRVEGERQHGDEVTQRVRAVLGAAAVGVAVGMGVVGVRRGVVGEHGLGGGLEPAGVLGVEDLHVRGVHRGAGGGAGLGI